MPYISKHAAAPGSPGRRRLAGVVLASAATVGGSVAVASPASAANVWDRVAQCESGGRWHIATGNGYYGGLQFSRSTWLGYGGARYASYAHRASKAQQITIAKKVLRGQGPGAWPVCSRRAGLTRANGGAVSFNSAASRSATRKAVNPRSSGTLAVDGVRGRQTNRAIERWVKGSVNGSLSKADWRKLERKVRGSVNGSFSRADTKKLQRVVRTRVDGSWGPGTTRALQRHLNRVL